MGKVFSEEGRGPAGKKRRRVEVRGKRPRGEEGRGLAVEERRGIEVRGKRPRGKEGGSGEEKR